MNPMTTLFKNLRPLAPLPAHLRARRGRHARHPETFAKWGRPSAVRRKKNNKRYRRHSRAWWRRYRARQKARRERALRRQAERQALSARNTSTGTASGSTTRPVNHSGANSALAVSAPRLPFDVQLPHTWTGGRKGASGEVTFAVRGADGRAAGTAVLAARRRLRRGRVRRRRPAHEDHRRHPRRRAAPHGHRPDGRRGRLGGQRHGARDGRSPRLRRARAHGHAGRADASP